MITLFCGSRSWNDSVSVRQVVADLVKDGLYCAIHGAAPGADEISGVEASKLDIHVVEFPAYWETLGLAAGPERNGRMLKSMLGFKRAWGVTVQCVGFHESALLGSGTRDMISKCMRADVPSRIVLSCDLEITKSQGCECGNSLDAHPSLYYAPGVRLLCTGFGHRSL